MRIARLCMKNFIRCLLLAALLVQAVPASPDDTPTNSIFLVANPRINDLNFRHSVVLITEPEIGGGPVGVILNHPLDVKLSEAVPGLKNVPGKFDPLFNGGPVEPDEVVYLVRTAQAPEGSLHMLPDVYLADDRDSLEKIMSGDIKVSAFRAFAGFASWAPGQLQTEIDRGDWYFIKADPEIIFAENMDWVWAELMVRINMVHTGAGDHDEQRSAHIKSKD
jgi:putative transcriptional regulator